MQRKALDSLRTADTPVHTLIPNHGQQAFQGLRLVEVLDVDTGSATDANLIPGLAMGTAGRLDHHYLKKSPTGWVNQIGITEFYSNGLFNHYPVTVIKGRFAYSGKVYWK